MENIKEKIGDLEDTVTRYSIHLIRVLKGKRNCVCIVEKMHKKDGKQELP